MSDIQAITYDDVQAVTPIASGNIWVEPVAGFFSNAGGNIQIVTARKTIQTLTINAGVIYPIAILSVLSGGTNIGAGNIYAVTTASVPYRGLRQQ